MSAGLHPGSNLKVGVHSTKSNGIKTSTDKCGIYMRMGYVYVVVIAAAALVSMLYGNDPSKMCIRDRVIYCEEIIQLFSGEDEWSVHFVVKNINTGYELVNVNYPQEEWEISGETWDE